MSGFRLKKLALCLSLLGSVEESAQGDVLFPESLLKAILPENQAADLSYFAKGYTLLPGRYDVDIYVNGQLVKRMDLQFKDHHGGLAPVLPTSLLRGIGLKPHLWGEADEVFAIDEKIVGITVEFEANDLRLNLTIPQSYFKPDSLVPNDVVSSELWDEGITAGMLNYILNASHYDDRQWSDTYNQYVNLWLEGQINWGSWRLFSTASYDFNRNRFLGTGTQGESWDFWNTYVQTDIPSIKSTVKMGELYVTSDLFDTFPMRGINLATNEQMLPYADRSFMPKIAGHADSFAQVIVRQNDRVIYQTSVAPGPWELDHLPPLSSSSDLEVVVREADGRERVEIVPCVALPMMLKEDQFRYDVSVGRYDSRGNDHNRMDRTFGQLTFSYGLPFDATLIGGLVLSEDYQAYAVGTAFSLGVLGALSFDVIQSHLSEGLFENKGASSGYSYRVRYKKSVESTGTSINLASYQYSSKDYFSFARLISKKEDAPFDTDNMKHRWQLSLSQPLGQWGHINASGNYVTYYDSDSDNQTWSLSYSKNWRGIGFYLTYSRTYERDRGTWEPNEEVMFNVSIPLGKFLGETTSSMRHVTAEARTVIDKRDGKSDSRHQVGLIYNDPESDWYWQAYQHFGSERIKESSVMLGYSGDRLASTASYSRSDSANTYQFSASGGAIVHDKGVTFSARAFDSVALIEVPETENVKINQSADVRTDGRGYAVVTNLRNYAPNELSIDPTTLPQGALMLKGTNRVIYPTSRAITRIVYPIRLGHQALVYLYEDNDQPLPFGTSVTFVEKEVSGAEVTSIVGESGRTYILGIPKQGCLRAKSSLLGKDLYYRFELPDRPSEAADESIVWMPHVHLKPAHESMCR